MLKPGDEVMVLPSGFTSRIAAIDTADGPVDEAFPPMSVTVRLADEIDISRGDMICRPHNAPAVAQDIEAMICWMDETRRCAPARKYAIKHTTRVGPGGRRGAAVPARRQHAAPGRGRRPSCALNEIGRVRLRTTVPLLADEYRRNRTTGGFILIDEATNRTVGAGMIIEASRP